METGVGRVVVHEEPVPELRLLHGQVGAGVLQLLGKGDGVFAGDGVEVLAQVGDEVQQIKSSSKT